MGLRRAGQTIPRWRSSISLQLATVVARQREKGPVRVLTTTRWSDGGFWRRGSDGAAGRVRQPSSSGALMAAARVCEHRGGNYGFCVSRAGRHLYKGEDRGSLACTPRRGVAESDSLSLSPARAGGGWRTRRAGPAYRPQRKGGAEMGQEKGNRPVGWAAW